MLKMVMTRAAPVCRSGQGIPIWWTNLADLFKNDLVCHPEPRISQCRRKQVEKSKLETHRRYWLNRIQYESQCNQSTKKIGIKTFICATISFFPAFFHHSLLIGNNKNEKKGEKEKKKTVKKWQIKVVNNSGGKNWTWSD